MKILRLGFWVCVFVSLIACAPTNQPSFGYAQDKPNYPTTQLPNYPTTQPRPTRAPTPTPSQPAIKTPAWFNDIVLYEIFPRSFYDTNGDGIGDLKGITAQLDYLKDLGVGALWLTPIFASPSYHGYDTTDYYAINPDLGTEDDLRELVRAAHARNIRVLLDYVVAHTSNQHPFFKDAYGNPNSKYADWYRWRNPERTSYESFASVAEMPTLNHDNPEVQRYLIDVAKYWMKTGIDGYRADYVLNVPHDFWKKLRAELKAVNPDFLLLAEAWTSGRGIKPYYDDEFDAAFDFPLYGDIEGSQSSVGDSVLLGSRSARALDGTLAAAQVLFPPGAQRVVFLNNHDTNRARSEVNGDLRRAKLGATLLLALPGTPMIYYGEEIGMAGVKGTDDKPLREPMDWYAVETGQGMTMWHKPADRNNTPTDGISVEEQLGKPGSLLEHYRALVALRNGNPALRTGFWERVETENDKVYAYLRRDSAASFLIVLNFDDAPALLTLDLGASSLPDGRYAATDVLTNKTFSLDGLTLKTDLAPVTGYVWRLVPGRAALSSRGAFWQRRKTHFGCSN